MIPAADIEIGETLSPMLERNQVKMRGVLEVGPVEEQLGYHIRYRDVRPGLVEYADRYCEYLASQGLTAMKRRW